MASAHGMHTSRHYNKPDTGGGGVRTHRLNEQRQYGTLGVRGYLCNKYYVTGACTSVNASRLLF